MRKIFSCILALLMLCTPLSASALCGDVDESGIRNAKDYMMLKRCVLESFELNTDNNSADVDQNGVINAKDYMMLKRCVLGTYDLPSAPQIKQDSQWTLLTQMLMAINEERTKNNLQPLVLSAELCTVAHDKSVDMAQNGYFDHVSPTYGEFADMLTDYGVRFYSAGENIAAGQQTVSDVMGDWMNSAGHRANILNPVYNEMGLGLAYGGEYGIYWTLILCQGK